MSESVMWQVETTKQPFYLATTLLEASNQLVECIGYKLILIGRESGKI